MDFLSVILNFNLLVGSRRFDLGALAYFAFVFFIKSYTEKPVHLTGDSTGFKTDIVYLKTTAKTGRSRFRFATTNNSTKFFVLDFCFHIFSFSFIWGMIKFSEYRKLIYAK